MAEVFALVVLLARILLKGYFLLALIVYLVAWLFGGCLTSKLGKLYKEKKVLLVTAHPDDECMFFAPFVLQAVSHGAAQKNRIFLFCLTNGNAFKLGDKREKELMASCRILGVPESNITILHREGIEDGSKEWDTSSVEQALCQHVDRIKPQLVLTFDDQGISGHINHISAHRAVKNIMHNPGGRFKGVEAAYYLESVNPIRKYVSIMDLPLALCLSENILVSSPAQILRAQRAMVAHSSQLVWFRMLYIVFSRYMMFNTFVRHSSPGVK